MSEEEQNHHLETLYLCGPMSGLPDFNRPAFRMAAEILREQGFAVVSPADFSQEGSWEALMKVAIPEMLSCDRVCVLGDWEKSRGARLEVFIARELSIPVETMAETLTRVPTKPIEQVRREIKERVEREKDDALPVVG